MNPDWVEPTRARRIAGVVRGLMSQIADRARRRDFAEQGIAHSELQIVCRSEQFPTQEAFVRWSITVGCHHAIDLLRRERPNMPFPEMLRQRETSPLEPLIHLMNVELAQLPADDRLLMELRYFDGWAFHELADHFSLQPNAPHNTRVSTVRRRIERILEELRRNLAGDESVPDDWDEPFGREQS